MPGDAIKSGVKSKVSLLPLVNACGCEDVLARVAALGAGGVSVAPVKVYDGHALAAEASST